MVLARTKRIAVRVVAGFVVVAVYLFLAFALLAAFFPCQLWALLGVACAVI